MNMHLTQHRPIAYRLFAFSMIVVVLAGCAALPGAAPATAAPEPLTLTILHTNDTLGYLYPCG
jgi:hypothetical protein